MISPRAEQAQGPRDRTIRAFAAVAYVPHLALWGLESQILSSVSVPLNTDGNYHADSNWETISNARKAANSMEIIREKRRA